MAQCSLFVLKVPLNTNQPEERVQARQVHTGVNRVRADLEMCI